MSLNAAYIPYKDTRSFSQIAIDYIAGDPKLQQFYPHSPDLTGIQNAIEKRKAYSTDRGSLVSRLKEQYAGFDMSPKVKGNIESLLNEDTFTITTAHQPNIFTGHLYFIYKIIHAIKLADELNAGIESAHFVPVFYMGTEDADLDELGQVTIADKTYTWKTMQSGAVGRMKVDKAFLELIEQIEGQIVVEPYGNEIMAMVRKAYTPGNSIEMATLELVNDLFGIYGLIILLPDHPQLKKQLIPVVKKELVENFSNSALAQTINEFPAEYKVQTMGRTVNLFYIKDDSRERIEQVDDAGYKIVNSPISFPGLTIFDELEANPERFSPNVILRPVYQEMILPNVAFIGGGGELAYWLELGKVFQSVNIPFPVLVLRNSFLIINKQISSLVEKLGFTGGEIFLSENELIKKIVDRNTHARLELSVEKKQINDLYDNINNTASVIDPTLKRHVAALSVDAVNKLQELEKKMFRAEKRKFDAQQRQIVKLRNALFPKGGLQERVDNLIPLYARYGKEILKDIYDHSYGLKHEFCILSEHKKS